MTELLTLPSFPEGSLVEYDDDGVPVRGSLVRGSPYYFDTSDLWVEFNGQDVAPMKCYEFDRRAGWVLCDHPEPGKPAVMYRGTVTARYRSLDRKLRRV